MTHQPYSPRRLLAITLATLAMAAVPAPANAQHRMTYEYASAVAIEYWAERGVTVPGKPTLRIWPEAEWAEFENHYPPGYGVYAVADIKGNQVWLNPLLEHYRRDPQSAWIYGQTIAHEFGHLAGLEHSDDPDSLMAPSPWVVPFGIAHPRQYAVLKGWRKPPRWVRDSPPRVERLWLRGRVWKAQAARARWLELENA
jgi:hypothetical protein